MSNRRDRRGASRAHKNQDAKSIPLARPDMTSTPSAQTLYQIAARNQPEIFQDKNVMELETTIYDIKDNRLVLERKDSDSESDSVAYGLTCLLYSVSLTMVHFTFDVLVHQQYRQEIDWDLIAWKTFTAFPVLFLLLYIFHWRTSTIYMQSIFALAGSLAGCYIVHASNVYSYFAVMQRAAPVGTLWIWCVFELEAAWAAISVAIVGIFFAWGGYTFR